MNNEVRQENGGHVFYQCPNTCDGCVYCLGGLAFCTVCKEGEAGLEKVCPGPPRPEPERAEGDSTGA